MKSNVLILDEATNGLDIQTEEKVISNLVKLDKTIIFITHRASLVTNTDKSIVIERGTIIQE
jgi:ABC-type bacteriocin/lantibiotic exporter with double-glycine peptidase domain